MLIVLLDDIESKYNVDKNREYLTGLSMGGHAAWSLAIPFPVIFQLCIIQLQKMVVLHGRRM